MSITEQAAEPVLSLAAQAAAVPPVRVKDDGEELPPDDPAAVSMYSAHRVDDAAHHLAHASERLDKARTETDPGVRAHHMIHLLHNLQRCLDAMHELVDNLRAHYPAEAAELGALDDTIGLAKAVSQDAKTATFAHLVQTAINHCSHTMRHAQAMAASKTEPEFAFNGEHARTHLDGAAEHVGKLTAHLHDNYPAEGGFLRGLGEIEIGAEDGSGKQKVSLAGTISGQAASPVTISGQIS